MGEFCTDLFFTADGLLPTDPPPPGFADGTTGGPGVMVAPLPGVPPPPPTIADSPEDSELEEARLGMFSFDARSMAELRRIMMVLVCGSISNRCSRLLLVLALLGLPLPPAT